MAPSDNLRPHFHFTPPANWINDPNGLVYYAGEYHLFYQYHPDSTVWGPMHWGHAISTDLVHWEDLPVALYPDELGAIFSGSAVIDWHNTAGFGTEAMIAFFTHDSPAGQRQSLAFSTDKGRTWTKYASNPILDTPPDEKNFRDPKVLWYDAGNDNGHWVMLLAVQDSIWFYTSTNLLNWHFASEFGEGHGVHDGVWETPDLFQLPVDRHGETRWVLLVGVGAGADVDWQGTQYFVGHFDGQTFQNDNSPATELWADHGPDFYAVQGWNDAPNQRKLCIAWMSNWIYAREIPATTWRGAMSLPRELSLRSTEKGIRLRQRPVIETQQLRQREWHYHNQWITAGQQRLDAIQGVALELIAEFQVDPDTTAHSFGLRVRVGEQAATVIGYDRQQQELFVDRTNAGQSAFNPHFAGVYRAPLPMLGNTVRLHIFVDSASVEVFGQDGLAAITALIFPAPVSTGVELFAQGGSVLLKEFVAFSLLPA